MSQPWATHRGWGAPVALLQKLLQRDHLTARRGRAGPSPCVGLCSASLLDAVLGERPVPGQGVLMAAEGGASWGAGIPWQSSRVPAGDQVFAAEALGPPVELVRGPWVAGGRDRGTHLSLPPFSCLPLGGGFWTALGLPKTERILAEKPDSLLPGWGFHSKNI